MRHLNKTILLLGTALLLQACASNDTIAVSNQGATPFNPADFARTAEEMTGGSVKVYSFDEDVPPALDFTDAGPGYHARDNIATDPNVMVYSLDGGPATYSNHLDAGIPPMMPPTEGAPYRSPFPGSDNAVKLRAPAPISAGAQDPSVMTPPPFYDDYGYEPAPHHQARTSISSTPGHNPQIYFAHGSARINAEGKQIIKNVAQRQLHYNPGSLIAVEGHASSRAQVTDPVERRILNLKMSMDRAFRVSSDLIRSGVPASAIKVTAYGDTRPTAPAPGQDAEAANRRVQILTTP